MQYDEFLYLLWAKRARPVLASIYRLTCRAKHTCPNPTKRQRVGLFWGKNGSYNLSYSLDLLYSAKIMNVSYFLCSMLVSYPFFCPITFMYWKYQISYVCTAVVYVSMEFLATRQDSSLYSRCSYSIITTDTSHTTSLGPHCNHSLCLWE